LLTSSTYCGRHHFNQPDSRTFEKRPPSQWVELAVPPIVDEETFKRAQAMFHARVPKVMAPRNVNGPTMLASVARCGGCGSAIILNTGKGGTYRYYRCSRAMKQGKTACPGQRIRMDRLDDKLLGHLSEQLFAPDRLAELLQGYMVQAKEGRAS
jgi:site-specific DNA recombinase